METTWRRINGVWGTPGRFLGRLDAQSTRLAGTTLFLVALAPRLTLVFVWQMRYPSGVFPDEQSYAEQARAISEGLIATSGSTFWNSTWAFFRPLVVLADVTDHHLLWGRVLSAVAGSLLVVMVVLIGRHWSPRAGTFGGLILALFPSQIFWSSLLLKDVFSAILMSFVLLALLRARSAQEPTRRIVSWAILVIPVWLLFGIRSQTAATVGVSLLIYGMFRVFKRRPLRKNLLPILGLLIVVTLGIATSTDRIPWQGTAGNEGLRRSEYQGAKTLISCDPIPFIPGPRVDEAGWANDFACSPFGLRMMLIDPLPTQLHKSSSLIPPFAEHLLWLPLVALATTMAFPRRISAFGVGYPLLLLGGLLLQWSLIDRVFGTAYRHRTEFAWLIFLLAGIRIANYAQQRRQQD